MLYRIYYGDGSIFESVDGSPPLDDAPGDNVQVIVHTDIRGEMGLRVTYNWDYYYLCPDDDIWGCNGEVCLVEAITTIRPAPMVFQARNAKHDTFFQILKDARAWAKEHGKSGGRRRYENGHFQSWESNRNAGP